MSAKEIKIPRFIQHLLFWTVYLLLNLLISSNSQIGLFPTFLWLIISLPVNMAVVYLHLWFLVPRLLLKRRYLLFFILFFITAIAFVLFDRYLNYHVLWPLFMPTPLSPGYRYLNVISLLYSGINQYSVVFLAVFIRSLKQWYESQQHSRELELRNKTGEIALLRMQINPHFLFNTLNNIHALISIDKEKAADALVMLSDIMRYMLYDATTDKVPLDQELQYLESYIALQKMRLIDPNQVRFSVEGDLSGKMIAPVLLIPFIENAFKHACKEDSRSGIRFSIVTGEKQIRFASENTCNDTTGNRQQNKAGGLGLENVKRRLDLLYPGLHQLEITRENNIFRVNLVISDK